MYQTYNKKFNFFMYVNKIMCDSVTYLDEKRFWMAWSSSEMGVNHKKKRITVVFTCQHFNS